MKLKQKKRENGTQWRYVKVSKNGWGGTTHQQTRDSRSIIGVEDDNDEDEKEK